MMHESRNFLMKSQPTSNSCLQNKNPEWMPNNVLIIISFQRRSVRHIWRSIVINTGQSIVIMGYVHRLWGVVKISDQMESTYNNVPLPFTESFWLTCRVRLETESMFSFLPSVVRTVYIGYWEQWIDNLPWGNNFIKIWF